MYCVFHGNAILIKSKLTETQNSRERILESIYTRDDAAGIREIIQQTQMFVSVSVHGRENE